MIRKDGPASEPFCIYTADGSRRIACHLTREAAEKQLAAIEASKHERSDQVQRFDAGRAGKVTPTPQGGVRVEATLTKVGVFTYRDSAGEAHREYRPPEEVLRADSVATLSGAPVTRGHRGMVGPGNWREVSSGHVLGDAVARGDRLEGVLFVQDEAEVRGILAGDVREVSLGYYCRLDRTPGTTPEGQAYDAVQRGIVYNHVALGPAGWGRQGSDVALRLDSGAAIMESVGTPSAEEPMKIKIDGIEYEAGSQGHLDAAAKELAGLQKRLDEATSRADRAEGERDAAKKEAKDLQARVEKFDADLETSVKDRIKLREDAAKVLGQGAEIPAEPRKLMEAVIRKDSGEDVDLTGKSEDYVRARFDAALERAGRGETPRGARISDFRDVSDRKGKTEERLDQKDPEAAYRERSRNAWKQPLAATADKR